MEKSVPKNPYFGGKGEETFRSLWVDEMSRGMAARKGDPLSGMILKAIEKQAASAAAQGGSGK
jgi:Rod binding domain-containing protein